MSKNGTVWQAAYGAAFALEMNKHQTSRPYLAHYSDEGNRVESDGVARQVADAAEKMCGLKDVKTEPNKSWEDMSFSERAATIGEFLVDISGGQSIEEYEQKDLGVYRNEVKFILLMYTVLMKIGAGTTDELTFIDAVLVDQSCQVLAIMPGMYGPLPDKKILVDWDRYKANLGPDPCEGNRVESDGVARQVADAAEKMCGLKDEKTKPNKSWVDMNFNERLAVMCALYGPMPDKNILEDWEKYKASRGIVE